MRTDLPLGISDSELLVWAEREDRILVTFDKATLASHLDDHQRTGHHSPGVLMLRRGTSLSEVVQYLVLIAYVSESWEWRDRITFIPV